MEGERRPMVSERRHRFGAFRKRQNARHWGIRTREAAGTFYKACPSAGKDAFRAALRMGWLLAQGFDRRLCRVSLVYFISQCHSTGCFCSFAPADQASWGCCKPKEVCQLPETEVQNKAHTNERGHKTETAVCHHFGAVLRIEKLK